METIIRKHAKIYPQMQPTDAVKLLYQSEFGPGHIVKDKESAKAFLFAEAEKTPEEASMPLFTEIGGGFARLNLASPDIKKLPLSLFAAIFVASAKEKTGSVASFEEKLELLKKLTAEGIFAFSTEELENYLANYKKNGYPPVSHSKEYHDAYLPAYRVVNERFIRLIPLMEKINETLAEKGKMTLAIDGRCGSGKSTAAEMLAEIYDANLVRMDDFFLPPSLRSNERYAEAGGNIHYERFLVEAAPFLKEKKPFRYRVFDCSVMDYGGEAVASDKPLTIVEGVYSLHTLWRDIFDLKVFFDIEKETQKERLIKRNGDYYRVFEEKWIPLEEAYFAGMAVREACEMIIK